MVNSEQELLGGPPHRTVFQPIVRLEDGRVVAYEALSRFEDGRSPEEHLAAARAAGQLVELELKLIISAVAASFALPADAMVTLNASNETILDERLENALDRKSPKSSQPRKWGIELPETSAVNDYVTLRDRVNSVGASLLIDDVGAGYANLERVASSRADVVKLDRSVLWNAMSPAPTAAKSDLDAMIAATWKAGSMALAEGVETADQALAMRMRGVELAQGYYFGRPQPAATWSTTGK